MDMNGGVAIFVLLIIAMVMIDGDRHHLAPVAVAGEDRRARGEAGGRTARRRECAAAEARSSRLEERLAVLERIATDPAERTAREIEQLRSGLKGTRNYGRQDFRYR